MKKTTLEGLLAQDKSGKAIARDLGEPYSKVIYWMRKYKLTHKSAYSHRPRGKYPCSVCGRDKKSGARRCPSCETTARRTRHKLACLAVAGMKCLGCNTKVTIGTISMFHFHHNDPDSKNFSPSSNLHGKWSDVVKELQKCTLLCANCHSNKHPIPEERVLDAIQYRGRNKELSELLSLARSMLLA